MFDDLKKAAHPISEENVEQGLKESGVHSLSGDSQSRRESRVNCWPQEFECCSNLMNVAMLRSAWNDLIDAEPWSKKPIEMGSCPPSPGHATRPIRWNVLWREGPKVFLVADAVVGLAPMNDGGSEATWATCSLNRWLNDDFACNAFDDSVLAVVSPGSAFARFFPEELYRGVFCLSEAECNKLFERVPEWSNESELHKRWMAEEVDSGYGDELHSWWTRTFSDDGEKATTESFSGLQRYPDPIGTVDIGVLPAMCIDLSLAFEPSRLSACNLPPEFAMVEEDGDLMHYFGRDSSVAIPETVRAVKAFSFCGSETLESVSMPDSTNVIESGAFSWCSKLRSVRCSSGLQKIGAFAFDDCHSLEEIELPDSLEEINSGAFRGCSSLRLISMSAKTKIVGYESGHFADVDPSIVRIR